MGLLICPDCEGKVSDKSPGCPHCGRPLEVTSSDSKLSLLRYFLIDLAGIIFILLGVTSFWLVCFGAIGTMVGLIASLSLLLGGYYMRYLSRQTIQHKK